MNLNLSKKENNWQAAQDKLAGESGLAIVITDERQPELIKSNNNSMCRNLYASEEFAPECEKYCGNAFHLATEAGKAVAYKCYAGLNCLAVPVKKEDKQLVAIVGRAFLKAEDYRNATERAISGDWQKFSPTDFFENALLSGSPRDLETLAKRLEDLSDEAKEAFLRIKPEAARAAGQTSSGETAHSFQSNETPETGGRIQTGTPRRPPAAPEKITGEAVTWRSLFGSLLNLNYKQACRSILQFLTKRYSISDLAWLERNGNRLEIILTAGKFKDREIQIGIAADDEHLLDALKKEISLELHERQSENKNGERRAIQLFPIAVGGEIQSAIIVGDEIGEKKTKRQVVRLCRTIAPVLEILRLREELSRRKWLERAVRRFNDSIKDANAENFWSNLAAISADLMQAERSSLLILDEKSNTLVVKAATGAKADIIKNESENVGRRVAGDVLKNGKPIVVEDAGEFGLSIAPPERNYKSNSFISYPITIGDRKIGVLNVTDKIGGGSYGDSDLQLLNAIMPQLGVLIDRLALERKAGEFEQLSVTDALTGLLNRRYLEERLAEEIKRSNRYGYPMSFLMIDVDDFKSYNDNFSHPEGDKALRLVGNCLKETLRGADVAARYGGEEFSILLPQTNSDEAETIAERIRERIAKTDFPKRQVTVSIGVASCSPRISNVPKLITAADSALYEAKRGGRNSVCVYKDLSE